MDNSILIISMRPWNTGILAKNLKGYFCKYLKEYGMLGSILGIWGYNAFKIIKGIWDTGTPLPGPHQCIWDYPQNEKG